MIALWNSADSEFAGSVEEGMLILKCRNDVDRDTRTKSRPHCMFTLDCKACVNVCMKDATALCHWLSLLSGSEYVK